MKPTLRTSLHQRLSHAYAWTVWASAAILKTLSPRAQRLQTTVRTLLFTLLIAFNTPVHAAISTQYAALNRQNDGGYNLNADFRLNLPNQLKEAIDHGTSLSFRVEFTLTTPRWYWADETLVFVGRDQRISYNSLTQEYRVSTDSTQARFNSLNEALQNVSRVSQWRVLNPNQINAYQPYEAAVRIYLITSKLPRTYQLNALTTQGWGLSSDWHTFAFTPR